MELKPLISGKVIQWSIPVLPLMVIPWNFFSTILNWCWTAMSWNPWSQDQLSNPLPLGYCCWYCFGNFFLCHFSMAPDSDGFEPLILGSVIEWSASVLPQQAIVLNTFFSAILPWCQTYMNLTPWSQNQLSNDLTLCYRHWHCLKTFFFCHFVVVLDGTDLNPRSQDQLSNALPLCYFCWHCLENLFLCHFALRID